MLNNFDRLFTWTDELQAMLVKRQADDADASIAATSDTTCDPKSRSASTTTTTTTAHAPKDETKDLTSKLLVDLVNRIVDDPSVSLKQKKAKLAALRRVHPHVYEQHFADLAF